MGNNLELESQLKLCKTVRLWFVQEVIKETEAVGFRKGCLTKSHWVYDEKKGILPDYACAEKVIGSLPHEITEAALGKYKPWTNLKEHKIGEAVVSAQICPSSLGVGCFEWTLCFINVYAGHQTAFRKGSNSVCSLMLCRLEKIAAMICTPPHSSRAGSEGSLAERFCWPGTTRDKTQQQRTWKCCWAEGRSLCQREAGSASLGLGGAGLWRSVAAWKDSSGFMAHTNPRLVTRVADSAFEM